MSFNVEDFINRYKEEAEAVKKQIHSTCWWETIAWHLSNKLETDFQDYMIIADSEFTVEEDYLVFKYKLDS